MGPNDPWESPFTLRVSTDGTITGTISHGPESAYGFNPWQLAADLNAAVERVLEEHGAVLDGDLTFEVD